MGLSIYGIVTISKSFLISKFIYICLLLPTPKEIVNKLNQLFFKFLWKGTDKETYEKDNAIMIDLKSIGEIFNDSNATWKRYLPHLSEPVGGLFFLNCNYEVSDYTISSQFYHMTRKQRSHHIAQR